MSFGITSTHFLNPDASHTRCGIQVGVVITLVLQVFLRCRHLQLKNKVSIDDGMLVYRWFMIIGPDTISGRNSPSSVHLQCPPVVEQQVFDTELGRLGLWEAQPQNSQHLPCICYIMIPHTRVFCASQATERSTAADLAKHVFENVFKLSHRNQSTCFWDWVLATSKLPQCAGQNNRRVCPKLLREDTLVGHRQVCSDCLLPIRSLPPPRTIQHDWYDGKFFDVFGGCSAKALLRRWHRARGRPCAEPHGCAGARWLATDGKRCEQESVQIY